MQRMILFLLFFGVSSSVVAGEAGIFDSGSLFLDRSLFFSGNGVASGNVDMHGNRLTDSIGPVQVGDSGTAGNAISPGNFYVSENAEFDGNMYIDGLVLLRPSGMGLRSNDDTEFHLGSGSDYWYVYNGTTTQLEFWSTNVGSGVDGKMLVFDDGSGTVQAHAGAQKGQYTGLAQKTESVTFSSGAGDASKVTTGAIIPGAFVVGVSSRVTTTATTCSSVDIGIAGKDTDAFADGTAVAATTTTTTASGNATADYSAAGLGITPSMTAQEITVTANGGNCVDGVWAITVHYFMVSAATAN